MESKSFFSFVLLTFVLGGKVRGRKDCGAGRVFETS